MAKLWCVALVLALSTAGLARTPGDDEPKPGNPDRAKTLEELTAEVQAQKAALETQRLQIQQLQLKAALTLDGTGTLPERQDKAKPSFPEDIKSKWGMNIYGFAEADFIYDNRQAAALTDGAFNPALPRGQSYATEHGQLTFGARNSRIGINANAPEYAGVRASAKLEMDFEGTQGGANSEANATWVSPTFRFRHLYLLLDSDIVTVQLGQGWQLFGWQPYFHPNTVDIQGVPAQVYSRSPKAQFSHKFKGPVDIELAAALSRPPQRDAGTPDVQAGIRLTLPEWTGVHTIGATGTAIDAAGLGFSGTSRAFRVPNISGGAGPNASDATRGSAVAAELFLPILHPEKESRANSLSFTGEIAYGAGYSEEYSGFNMGVPALGAGGVTGITDQGSIAYWNNDLKAIQLRTTFLGLQYYLPGDGTLWTAVNYGTTHSNNIGRMSATPGGAVFASGVVFKNSQFLNLSLFWDATPAIRLGLSFDQYRDTYVDEKLARDSRIQFSAFYLF